MCVYEYLGNRIGIGYACTFIPSRKIPKSSLLSLSPPGSSIARYLTEIRNVVYVNFK